MDIKTRLQQSTYRKNDARIVDLRKRVLEDGPIVEGAAVSYGTGPTIEECLREVRRDL